MKIQIHYKNLLKNLLIIKNSKECYNKIKIVKVRVKKRTKAIKRELLKFVHLMKEVILILNNKTKKQKNNQRKKKN